jgi:hypothetical protein
MASPPLLRSIDTPDHLAWQLYGEIIFWTHNKPKLDEAKVHSLCAPLWERLRTEVPQAAVDPLMQLEKVAHMAEPQESNPVRDLFTRWREPIREILERALDKPDSLTSLFPRGMSWISKEYPGFIIRTLGEVGNSHTAVLLESLVDSTDAGADAVEAVRKLRARLV